MKKPFSIHTRPLILLSIIFLIFILPILLALIFYKDSDKLIFKTTNHGTLIQPSPQLTSLQLKTSDGANIPNEQLHGKWLLLYVNPINCNQNCQKTLFYMRQIRLATGAERDRVQRAIITFKSKKPDSNLIKFLQGNYQGTQHWITDKKQFRKIMGITPLTMLAMTQGYIYLVDPLGNIMMGYALTENPSDIFKDLQKLLKVSQIG